MRSYKFHKEDKSTSDDKIAENARMMKEFLKKGGKIQKIPYGVTSQDLGSGNANNLYLPHKTMSPKQWRRQETLKKKKKK